MRMLAVSLLVVAAVLAGKAAAPAAGPQTITGTDGPGFTISLKQHGKPVKGLAPATYVFVINDDSDLHNFHLIGPGVSKKTTVPFTGERTWTVRLKKGRYTYQCDVHAANGMKGSFRVT